MMIGTSGKFLSVVSVWSAIDSMSIGDVPVCLNADANYMAPRIADKTFLRIVLETILVHLSRPPDVSPGKFTYGIETGKLKT
jgi:hypothetical protein